MAITYTDDPNAVSAEDVRRLFASWRQSPTMDGRLSILRAAHSVVLAWSDERLVGFITAISDGISWAYITLLEVPGVQRQGIGGELVRRMLGRYADLYGIDLNCDDALVGFYERLGFRRLNGMVIRNDAALT